MVMIPGAKHVTRYLLGALLVAALLVPAAGSAQTCSAEVDRTRVQTGGTLKLTISISGEVQGADFPAPPSVEGVRFHSGGTSRNFSMINGQSSYTIAVSYHLVVERDTDFVIPAIEVPVAGTVLKTQPIPITVTAATRSEPVTPGGNRPATGGASSDRQVFITLEIDHDEAWVGEQIILTFRFYQRRDVHFWNQPQYTPPRTEGFWREDLPPRARHLRTVGGRTYEVTEFNYALFPTRSGVLDIEPAEVVMAQSVFDSFGRRGANRGPDRLRTEAVRVTVRPLPRPQPEGYCGVVARRFDLSAEVDRRSVPRGEPVELKVELVADGFLKSLDGLPLPETEGLRMHDSRSDLAAETSPDGVTSRFFQEKVLIPLEEGRFELTPISLTWFDPARGEYRTRTTEAIALEVGSSDMPVIGDEQGTIRGEIERLGRDLAFIHPAGAGLRSVAPPLVLRPLWWLLLVMPLAALVVLRAWLGRLRRDWADPRGVRRRRALAVARRTLKRCGSDDAEAGATMARAITVYVADRSGRSAAAIGVAEVRDWAEDLGCGEAGRRLAEMLVSNDAARFAGAEAGGTRTSMAPKEIAALLADIEGAESRGGPKLRCLVWPLVGLLLTAAGAWPAPVLADGRAGPDPTRLLAEANQLYTGGDIDAALAKYSAAVDAGAEDATLFYNLGNARARRGELGEAILNYLRAERLAPRDRDIGANLEWVRSHTADVTLTAAQLPPVIRQIAGALRLLSLDEWSLVVVGLVWVMGILVAIGWLRSDISTGLRRSMLGCGVLLTLAVLVCAGLFYEQQVQRQAVVIAGEVEVRSGPATEFPVVFRVHDGLTLQIRGERDDWARIGLGGEWVGWLPASSVVEVRRSTRGGGG